MSGFFYSDQARIWGERSVIGFGDDSFLVREMDRKKANEIVRSNHYSRVVYAGSYIHLGVYAPTLLGVLQFGVAMNPASQASVVADTKPEEYLELNRMWLSDKLPRNSESRAIAAAFKYIRRAWPSVAWVQSFADERCRRFGVVYQACNFLYCGEHDSVFWEIDGEWFHNSLMSRDPSLTPKAAYVQANKERAVAHTLRQFRYLYFLKASFRARLLLKVLPYPKPAAQLNGERGSSTVEAGVSSPVPLQFPSSLFDLS